jgi:hypothetical protein
MQVPIGSVDTFSRSTDCAASPHHPLQLAPDAPGLRGTQAEATEWRRPANQKNQVLDWSIRDTYMKETSDASA